LAEVAGQPEQVGAGELLETVEPCDHVLGCGDLQGGWPLIHQLPPAGANLQSVLHVGDVRAECDSGPVCGHIQGVHHLAVGMWGVGVRFRGRSLGRLAVALDQMPGAGEIVGDLRQSFVERSLPWPVSEAHAAADRLPDRPQPLH
jgi:hypothetical protein